MAKMMMLPRPTGVMLVGVIFICLLQGLAAGDPSPTFSDALSKIEEFHSDFIHHQEVQTLGQLQHPDDAAYFPRDSRQTLCPENHAPEIDAPDLIARSFPTSERTILKGSDPKAWVKDLSAVNSINERDLIYGESLLAGSRSQGQANSMNVIVAGERSRAKVDGVDGFDGHAGDFDIEHLVDGALGKDMRKNAAREKNSTIHGSVREGNYLNVDVSGISVSAINTVQGGSAVATSNIIIKPVQIIVSPAEVHEKLI
jgi:hypothetical protein